MKTYYEKWLNRELGYIGLGSFHLSLMETYKYAGSDNREKLEKAFPEYFLPEDQQPEPEPDIYFSDQMREDLLVTALEGGSNYWYYLADRTIIDKYQDKDMPLAIAMWKAILAGESVPVWDINERQPNNMKDKNKLGDINLIRVRNAERIMFSKHKGHYIDASSETGDAITADVWFQLAIMGKITFG